ncbi:tetratricopeptide repeat protein [Sulfurovum sp.]|uniref:SEL1-like repeat protein n=1 Tax=Sulfurovum sp. TaxID=1969726 RepID=UPI0035671AE9
MKIYKVIIGLLLIVNTLLAETTAVDIDTFLESIKVPVQKEILCKDVVKTNTEYMQCLEEKTANAPTVENINFLAGIYAVQRDYAKALELYKKSIDNGDKAAVYFTAGIYNEALKEHEKALPYFQKIKEYKDSTCQIGGIYAIVKDESYFKFINKSKAKSKTLDFYDEEIEKDNMNAYGCKALYYMSLQEYGDAEDVINEGIKRNDITSLFLMGQLRDQHAGSYDKRQEMFEYYQQAADLGYAKGAHNLGVIFAQEERWAEAEAAFRREIEIGNTDALLDLARVYRSQKKYETAEKFYRKLAEFGNYQGLYQAGLMYAKSGDEKNYKKAEAIYQECIDNGYGNCASGMGLLYKNQLKEYDQAIAYYKLGNKMGDAIATYNLGVLYGETLQDQANEIVWYLKAVEMGDANAAFNMGHIYEFDDVDYPKAIQWYRKAIELGRPVQGRIYEIEYKMKHEKGEK